MKNYTVKCSIDTLNKLKDFYQDGEKSLTSSYMVFRASFEGGEVTAYKNEKNMELKVVFSGVNAYEEARIWDSTLVRVIEEPSSKYKKESSGWKYIDDHAGSDEVGFGDFFGPLVVAGVFLKKHDIALLDELHVNDSKKMSDEQILSIGETLIRKLKCIYFTVSNDKLADLTMKGYNMNKIKAYLHNLALYTLQEKQKGKYPSFIDQFCTPKRFESYLEDQPRASRLTFQTKAESDFPAVAAASVIARYVFLKRIKALEQEYGVQIPLGASSKVDDFAYQLAKTIGLERVTPIVKKNFINYQRLLEKLTQMPV